MNAFGAFLKENLAKSILYCICGLFSFILLIILSGNPEKKSCFERKKLCNPFFTLFVAFSGKKIRKKPERKR